MRKIDIFFITINLFMLSMIGVKRLALAHPERGEEMSFWSHLSFAYVMCQKMVDEKDPLVEEPLYFTKNQWIFFRATGNRRILMSKKVEKRLTDFYSEVELDDMVDIARDITVYAEEPEEIGAEIRIFFSNTYSEIKRVGKIVLPDTPMAGVI